MTHRGLRFSGRLRGAGLLGGLALACGVALTATSGWLIVQASTRPVILSLLVAIVCVRTFGIGRPVFRYAERLRSHDAALGDLADARVDTYRRLIPLAPARLGRRARSEVLTAAVRDLDDEVEAQVRVVVPLVSAAFGAVVAIVVSLAVWPPAALIPAVLSLVLAAIVVLLARLESAAQVEGLGARAEATRVAALVTSNAGELAAIGAGEDASAWLSAAHERVERAAGRQGDIRALGAALVLLSVGAATAASALLLLPQVGGPVSRPLAALLLLIPLALGEVTATLPEATGALARSRAAAARLQQLLAQTPAVREPASSTNIPAIAPVPRITLDSVTAGWTPGRVDLPATDLVIEPGEHLALVGPNGVGKSTLLAVLARHLDPCGGRMLVDGVDIRELPLARVRDLMAVVDDEPHLFASSVRNNLTLARPGAGDDEVAAALVGAGLGDWLSGLPEGLDTRIGQGGRGVSGGERARLAVARALLSRRPILLLDEPVAHLDHPTAQHVLSDLFASAYGRTVCLITHRAEGTTCCGRVVEVLTEPGGGDANAVLAPASSRGVGASRAGAHLVQPGGGQRADGP